MPASGLEERVAAVRRFNRFYTQRIGVLDKRHLGSPHSLGEARILYEVAQREDVTAAELSRSLGLDAGYLSRMLSGLESSGLIKRARSAADGRARRVSLTQSGTKVFAALNDKATQAALALLGEVPGAEHERLLAAMQTIERLLETPATRDSSYVIRAPRPGELGWVVQRHGAVYAEEHRYDSQFEALVARIVADFAENHDPVRERCWIAAVGGEPVGSIFLVEHSSTIAKLRLLLVEPRARGLGIGSQLIKECVFAARQCGYRKLRLWTQSHLTDARRLYQAAGFVLINEEPHRSFGRDLVAQIWELRL